MAIDKIHIGKIDELIKDNQQIPQRDIAVKLGISQEHASHCWCSSILESLCKTGSPQADSRDVGEEFFMTF